MHVEVYDSSRSPIKLSISNKYLKKNMNIQFLLFMTIDIIQDIILLKKIN